MMYDYIVWDWNGTLLDDVKAAVNAVNALLIQRGLPTISVETYRRIFAFPVQQFYRDVGFHLEEEDWDTLSEAYHALFLADTHLRLQDGVCATLDCFQKAGIRQAVLSACHETLLNEGLSHFGIATYFEHICGVNNLYGAHKIARGHELMAKIKQTFPRDRVCLVGDSLHDVEVADALHIACVLVSHGHQDTARLLHAGCEIYPTLPALAQAILA